MILSRRAGSALWGTKQAKTLKNHLNTQKQNVLAKAMIHKYNERSKKKNESVGRSVPFEDLLNLNIFVLQHTPQVRFGVLEDLDQSQYFLDHKLILKELKKNK